MSTAMPQVEGNTVQTRASLVQSLQAGDEDRWQEFYQLYGPVIRGFALKAGLTETEADEVVQETCIGVARNVGEFHYDPKVCRFKTWLLNLASWRVKNQFTKRRRWDDRVHGPVGATPIRAGQQPALPGDDSTRTPTVERVADPNAQPTDALWDEEWRANLMKAALDKVRLQFSPTQFQIFDLNALKEWPASEVATSLGVSLPSVYLARHRVTVALKKEIARLEQAMEERGKSLSGCNLTS